MTETEWNCSDDLLAMLDWLNEHRGFSDRKARLFAVAVCRRIWDLLPDARSRIAVAVAEQFVDGLASRGELEAAHGEAHACCMERPAWAPAMEAALAAEEASSPMVKGAAFEAALNGKQARSTAQSQNWNAEFWDAEQQAHADLLRDLCGPSPFRPLVFDRVWLAWHDGMVLKLAHNVYEERHLPEGTLDNALLAVLADALEEAGCTNQNMLSHCRNAGTHVRGCWAVDMILAKQ